MFQSTVFTFVLLGSAHMCWYHEFDCERVMATIWDLPIQIFCNALNKKAEINTYSNYVAAPLVTNPDGRVGLINHDSV